MLCSSIASSELPNIRNLLNNRAMDNKAIRRQNLLALKAKHRTFRALAAASDTDPAVLSQINIHFRDMGDAIARRIEERLGLGHGWMDALHLNAETGIYNVDAPRQVAAYAWPLVSWVSAGLRAEAVAPYENGDAPTIDFSEPPLAGDMALQVRGDSMLRPDGSGFPDGCYIAIRPSRRPKNGDFVVVRFAHTDEATFKQFAVDGPVKLLRPLNPAYPTHVLAPDAIIVGTVVEKHSIEKF